MKKQDAFLRKGYPAIFTFILLLIGATLFDLTIGNAAVNQSGYCQQQYQLNMQSNDNYQNREVVSDPSWGYKVVIPEGWKYQKSENQLVLGHDNIAGMIFCFGHYLTNIDEVRQQLSEGLAEEGNYLFLSGNIETISQNILAGDYQGTMDMTQVKAKGYGTLSPFGGGAFIIAVSTPEAYGDELESAAKKLATDLQYIKLETSDLMQHFAGKWTSYSKNTSTWIYFGAHGTYSENFESSYSGDSQNEYGEQTGSWGTANQSNSQGRWTVRGTKDQGQIIVTMNDGSQMVYNYKVNVENGQVYYNNYYLNGKFYFKGE